MRAGLFQYDPQPGVVPPGSITNAELADMAALTVKANATSASASPQDVAASANDQVFRRTSDTLNWGGVTNGMLTTNSIGLDKLVDASAQYQILGRRTAGTGAWEDCTRTELNIAGTDLANTFNQNNIFERPSGTAASLTVRSENATPTIACRRASSDASAPSFSAQKTRGTLASPTVVATNDVVGDYNFQAYNGSSFSLVSRVRSIVTDPSPSATSMGTNLIFSATPNTSAVLTEAMRLDHQAGLQAFGTNVFLDTNRIFRPRSYTTGTLPAAPATGIVHCSNLGGGGALLQSNGSAWIRVKPTGTTNIAVDANLTFTWNRLTNAPVTRANVALTATRTVTLSTTGCQNGDRAHFVRSASATGAFNWAISGGTTKNLATAGEWCTFEFDGSAWNIIAFGTGAS